MNDPVQYYVQYDDIYLDANSNKIVDIYSRSNQYTLNDDYFSMGSKYGEFLSFSNSKINSRTNMFNNEITAATFNFLIDDQIDQYERSFYSVWDLIGQLGGIYEIFYLFTFFFANYYNK